MACPGGLEDHQDWAKFMTKIRLATALGDQGIAMHRQELLEAEAAREKPFAPAPIPILTSSSTFAEAAARFKLAIANQPTKNKVDI